MIFVLRRFQLLALCYSFGILSINAIPRVLKGTVYHNGKPASGVLVTVHKSRATYFTSFDGKYELKADTKTRWIKFTFNDQSTKLNIDPNGSEYIDCDLSAEKKLAVPAVTIKTNSQEKTE
jgi:hypothetical protein